MNIAGPLGVGIVGAGAFAHFVASAAAALDGVSVTAVTDTNAPRAQELAAAAHAEAVVDLAAPRWSLAEDVDAVVIATPPCVHADMAVQALSPRSTRLLCYERLPSAAAAMLSVPGGRPSGHERIDVKVERHAAPPARGRDVAASAAHHVTAPLDVGGPHGKRRVYRKVCAALGDLVASARTGAPVRADITAGHAAVRLAVAATAAWHDATTHHLSPEAP